MGFKPGQTGNPKGRPKKGRALAEILQKAGNTKVVNRDGDKVTRKQMLAEMLWQVATEGTVDFLGGVNERTGKAISGGSIVIDSMAEWFAIAKFVHQHLDGPVRPEIELPGNGVIHFSLSVKTERDEPREDVDDEDEDPGE